jgi:IS1 family transposase
MGNPASGTPVWLWDCNGGPAQQWAYDRKAQTVVNTAFGKCLQARPTVETVALTLPKRNLTIAYDDNRRGVQAEIADCIPKRTSTLPTVSGPALRQQWTYDPERGILQNALGTVLDIQWNNQQAGTLTWLWDYNGQSSQQWLADPQ